MHGTENPKHLSHNTTWRPLLGRPPLPGRPGWQPPPQGWAPQAAPESQQRGGPERSQLPPEPLTVSMAPASWCTWRLVTTAAAGRAPSWQASPRPALSVGLENICAFPKSWFCFQSNQMVNTRQGPVCPHVPEQTSTSRCFQPAQPFFWPPGLVENAAPDQQPLLLFTMCPARTLPLQACGLPRERVTSRDLVPAPQGALALVSLSLP